MLVLELRYFVLWGYWTGGFTPRTDGSWYRRGAVDAVPLRPWVLLTGDRAAPEDRAWGGDREARRRVGVV